MASPIVTKILAEAEAARAASAGKAYKSPGSTTEGFDCSGFVRYVLDKAHGPKFVPLVTADQMRTLTLFKLVADRQPGDLVFFSPQGGKGKTATHVAIVVDDTRFIGSQSSTGVAYVSFDNTYWKPKILEYRRLAALE